jgi:hypothetical protein
MEAREAMMEVTMAALVSVFICGALATVGVLVIVRLWWDWHPLDSDENDSFL